MITKFNKIGWQRVLLIFLPYLFIVGIFQFIGALIANIDFLNIDFYKTPQQDFIRSISSLIGTIIVIWYFTKKEIGGNSLIDGFRIKNRLIDFIIGLSVGTLIISLGYIILLLSDEIIFISLNFNLKKLALTTLTLIFVVITEEVFIRGYVLRNLMISFNKYLALLLSSILFAIMHGFNPSIDLFSLTSLFVAGLLLGITYIYTKNLWFPIALHFSWNFMQAMLGFNISGHKSFSIVEFNLDKSNRLNGGGFGFEGSILSIVFQLLFVIIIELYYRRKTNYYN